MWPFNKKKKQEKKLPTAGPTGYGGYLGTYSRSQSAPPAHDDSSFLHGMVIGSMLHDNHHQPSDDSDCDKHGRFDGSSHDSSSSDSSSYDSGSSDSGSSYDSGSSDSGSYSSSD